MALTVRDFAAPPASESSTRWRALVVSMRPQQWTKNLIVFAAPVFSMSYSLRVAAFALLAFFAFCAISSATYLVNDAADVRADRLHPLKRYRPIAAGQLSVRAAVLAAGSLVVASVWLSLLISPGLVLAVAIYGLLQVAYNLWLKREPIVDVLTVSAGFVTRAIGGAAAASVMVSTWFLLCVALLATFLALEKRRAELRALGEASPTRAVLREYSLNLLGRIEDIVVAAGLIAYSLWAAQRTEKHWMLVTVSLVAYVLFKYQMLAEKGGGEEPETVLLKSPKIMIALVLWVALCVAILAFQGHGAPWQACSELC
jgi:decaprenyl-phosphate phosphoribosyltransferase